MIGIARWRPLELTPLIIDERDDVHNELLIEFKFRWADARGAIFLTSG